MRALTNKFALIFLSIGILVLVIYVVINDQQIVFNDSDLTGPTPTHNEGSMISSFEECVAAGNAVMESYPRQCRVDGQTFVEDIGNELEKIDVIHIDNPRPNQTVSSPLDISGEARGTWYFEAEFPVVLLDGDYNVIAEGFVTAQGDWMTEEIVPYEGEIIFEDPGTDLGVLILEKANPSGLPENADELRIPVSFSER